MYRRVLVALDGSELAERVLPHVEALAQKFDSHLVLVRAVARQGPLASGHEVGPTTVGRLMDPTPESQVFEEEAERYLRALADHLRHRGYHVDYEQVEGPAGQVILDRARALGADLIAMTTHGRTGLGRLVLGSVAEEVVTHAPCPVLLVRVG